MLLFTYYNQAAAAVAAERERSTLYNELDDRWLSSMGWEDYGSESFSRPPPELFGFNQVREHPSHASATAPLWRKMRKITRFYVRYSTT